MPIAFDPILKNPSVKTRTPCGSGEIDNLAGQFSATIPERLVEFWQTSNGAVLTGHNASILGTSEVTELLSVAGFGEWLLQAGFLPLLYDQESNYLCIALRAPLSPRVIYVLHDDSPKLLYRDADAFFAGCADLLASNSSAGLYFHDSNGDYGPDTARTADDLATANSLMQSKDDWFIPVAIQLLDSTCADEWNELLNGDRFARQDALTRLKSMSSMAAKRILDRDAKEFDAFANDVCNALTVAAMPFERRDTVVKIDRSGMDLNAFFGRRHIDNAIPRLVNWFKDVRDGNTPLDRPGHYMAD